MFPINTKSVLDYDVRADQDGPAVRSLIPFLYQAGQLKLFFNTSAYLKEFAYGCYCAAVVFFIPAFALHSQIWIGSGPMNGHTSDQNQLFLTVYACVMIVVNANIVLRFNIVSVLDFVAIGLLSFGVYLAFIWLSEILFQDLANATSFTY